MRPFIALFLLAILATALSQGDTAKTKGRSSQERSDSRSSENNGGNSNTGGASESLVSSEERSANTSRENNGGNNNSEPGPSLCIDEPRDPGTTALSRAGLQGQPLRVGAFQVTIFGDSKFSKEPVVQSLLQTIIRYDILLFQDIRDADQSSFIALMERLNNENGDAFDYKISQRLGRSSAKEQYAYIFRKAVVSVASEYQYPDVGDVFEREPFGIIVTPAESGTFGLLGLHAKPADADTEVDALVDVYDDFRNVGGVNDVLLLGDFNADCTYVTASEWPNIRLRTDARFQWYIDDDADTTVNANTDCAYDRLVAAGSELQAAIVTDSAAVYRFDTEQGLTSTEAAAVSASYPVELLIYGRVDQEVLDEIDVSTQACAEGNNNLSSKREIKDAIRDLDEQASSADFDVQEDCGEHVTLVANGLTPPDVFAALCLLGETAPDILSEVLYRALLTYLGVGHALGDVAPFPGVFNDQNVFSVNVDISPENTKVCVFKIVA